MKRGSMSSSSSGRVNLESYLIPLDEINRATENFNRERCIGGGGFGAVYKGQLSERWQNRVAAIKRLSRDSHQGEREFRTEIEMISKFHHENIISFIGYCDQHNEMIIVYEYAMYGSLDHHLQDPNKMSCMTWTQRLEICLGAARGLNYLHSGLGDHNRVIHRDVKSANILLDANMVAKICDFGLSKFGSRNQPNTSQIYTKVAGTQFYMDPTYHESRILRKESDVYSFGIVLFEMLSGMLVYHSRSITAEEEPQLLMTTVRRYHESEPDKVIDPFISHEIDISSFHKFQEIAYRCISYNSRDRPTLDTVISMLEEALSIQIFKNRTLKIVLGKLNSKSPEDHRIACGKISSLIKKSHKNIDMIGESWVIPMLISLLNKPDDGEPEKQELAVAALVDLLDYYNSTRDIVCYGGVKALLRVLTNGSLAARENALRVIYNLIQHGGKAASACTDQFTDRVVSNLSEFVKDPGNSVSYLGLRILAYLSVYRSVRLVIGEAEMVPLLVAIIGSVPWRSNAESATTILKALCLDDQKYLVEAQEEYGVMDKLMDLIQDGDTTDSGKRVAKELLQMIKDHY